MRKPICAACGKPATAGSLCDEHYTERNALFDIKPFAIQICDGCGSVFDQKWQKEPVEDVIRAAVERVIKRRGNIEDIDIILKPIGIGYAATVEATGTIPPATTTKTEAKTIEIRARRLKCQSCVKLLGNYHEAAIQVRGERAERLVELAENALLGAPMRVELLKYGWNLYFVHKAGARAAVKSIETALLKNDEKRLEVIRSHKLVGRKLGKDLWRDFYAIR